MSGIYVLETSFAVINCMVWHISIVLRIYILKLYYLQKIVIYHSKHSSLLKLQL